MQTHKNPDLRLHSAVPFKASPKPFKSMGSGRSDTLPDKPAKCELQGKKWIVVSLLYTVISIATIQLKLQIFP